MNTVAALEADICVVGTGPAGLAVGLALSRAGYKVTLIGPKVAAGFTADKPLNTAPMSDFTNVGFNLEQWRNRQTSDPRVYALTPDSQAFLQQAGVWSLLHSNRLAPLYDIEVYQGLQPKPIRFDSADAAQDRLATIVEHGHLTAALQTAVHYSNVRRAMGQVTQITSDENHQHIELDAGERIRCKLLIAADGGRSPVRALMGIETIEKSYNQTAIVANFQCDLPHRGLARQWFLNDGIVALLPLSAPEQVNLVWSAANDSAAGLLNLNSTDFAQRLEAACSGALGSMKQLDERQYVALAQIKAKQIAANRLVLLGDAAHVIHPMAGHGLNLGFGDAACLVRTLGEPSTGRRADDPGLRHLLRRYERERSEPIAVMNKVTDGLFKLFFEAPKPVQWLRDAGWSLVGRSAWIKKRMVNHASSN